MSGGENIYGEYWGALTIELYSEGGNLNVKHNLPDGDGKNGIKIEQQTVYMAAVGTLIRKIGLSGPRMIIDEVRHGYKWAVRYEPTERYAPAKPVPLKLGEQTPMGQYCGSIVVDIYNDAGKLYCRCFYPVGNGAGGLSDGQKNLYLGAAKNLQKTIEAMGPGKLIELVAPTKAPMPVKEMNA